MFPIELEISSNEDRIISMHAQMKDQNITQISEGMLTRAIDTDEHPKDWQMAVGAVCEEMLPKTLLDKFFQLDAPLVKAEALVHILESFCIFVDKDTIEGQISTEQKFEFLGRILEILELRNHQLGSRSDAFPQFSEADNNQLNVGCKNIKALESGSFDLFRGRLELAPSDKYDKSQHAAWEEDLGTNISTLEKEQAQMERVLQRLPIRIGTHTDEQLLEAQSELEHSLGAFTSSLTEFQMIFSQDIDPWIRNLLAPEFCGIGELVNSITSPYEDFNEVLSLAKELHIAVKDLEERASKWKSRNDLMSIRAHAGTICATEMLKRAH